MNRLLFGNRTVVILFCYSSFLAAAPSVTLANGVILSEVHSSTRIDVGPAQRVRPIERWTPFEIKSQRVDVSINETVSETTVEQVFFNGSGSQSEGRYLFPFAENAGVDKFTMWMNDKEVTAELLDARQARQIYESIVNRMRDPGLLQFAGRGLIQAKVFPIPAGGECRIRLRYTEPVKVDGGLASYRFPLGSSGCQFQPIEKFSLRATVRTERPLISVFSASHDVSVDRRSEREVVVGYEGTRISPDSDLQLFARVGSEPFGISILGFRDGADEGFFMARVAPGISRKDDAVQPKNICFVLDTSGSMADHNKIAQAKKALQFCVTNLNKLDRFNIITFSTEVRPFRESWSLAEESSKSAAREFIGELNAVGGTDIDGALKRAIEMRPTAKSDDPWTNNPYLVVFITDGEPTVGVTDPDAILKNVASLNGGRTARIFSLGVGFQVNTKLLDRLSDDNGGARDYVTPTEDLEIKISSFYTKLANPILSNLKLVFEGVSVHDVYPRMLPDLFEGSELVVVGRYNGAKRSQRVELTGQSRGESRSFAFPCSFLGMDTRHDFLPRFWAMRKIGFLLDELRLHGETPEVKTEVIRLAKQYGILTPYTSFLVQEDERIATREGRAPTGGRSAGRELRASFTERDEEAKDAAVGQTMAVGASSNAQSKGNQLMRQADCQAAGEELALVRMDNCDADGRSLINFIGSQTFYLENGRWVDSRYDEKTETIKVALYSPQYFELLSKHRELGACMAQGERVVVNCGGKYFETVPATPAAEKPAETKPDDAADSGC